MFCPLHTICHIKTSKSDVDKRIKGRQIDIEFIDLPSNKSQQIKLHNVPTSQQKLHMWLVIVLSIASIISDLTSIAGSVGLLFTNSTCRCKTN